jgi:hexosaminidase
MNSHARHGASHALLLMAGAACAAEPALVPRPASLELREGEFAPRGTLRVGGEAGSAAQFAARLRAACGRAAEAVADGGDIVFAPRDTTAAFVPESYRLEVTPAAATVFANEARGWRHGATTLIQLLCAGATVPALMIDDAPQFAWRGLMLDSARHFQSPAYIKRFLDAMALHKLNVLHWHLTDDQAWRLEIRAYPKLTTVGAWRVPAGDAARADIDPATGKPRLHGGFYSQHTVREIVAHAAALGITVVPEIEMPGHASAAIAAYPELGAKRGAVDAVPADWGVYPNAFALDDATFAFLEGVLRETMAMFPSPYIHVGGDEVEPGQWQASAPGRALLAKLGSEDGHVLQAEFTNRIGRFLAANGRTLVGWDEILSPGLAKDAVVMSWRGVEGAIKAAALGHDTVLSAWPTLYFDNRQSPALDQPPGRVKVLSLQEVYAFDPLPPTIGAGQRKHVLGVQGAVWTEHIRTEARVDHMTFPRAAAIAELGWTPAARRGWEDFARRVPVLFPLYESMQVAYARNAVTPAALPAPGDARSSRELKLCGEAIPIVVEDDGPVAGERALFALDLQQPCWIFEDAALAGVSGVEARVGQIPFNFQIGAARDAIAFSRPQTPDGELEVRLDDCDGEVIARLPVAPATASTATTTLPVAPLPPQRGRHDLCLRFAQPALEPVWTLDRFRLVRE